MRIAFFLLISFLSFPAGAGITPVVATAEQKQAFSGNAEISGRFTWSDGSPAANTTFDLLAYDGENEHLKIGEVTTGSDGRYRAPGLRCASARYRFWLTADSNQRTFYIFVPKPDSLVEYNYQFQPRLGDPAPEHIMPDLSGKPVDLADFKGSVVVMKFWAVWCGPCHAEMIEMGNTLRRRSDWRDTVVILAVNADPERSKVVRFIEEKKLEGMVHLFEEGKKWESIRDRAFRVNSVPFTFIIDRQGIVRYRSDEAGEVEKVVDQLMSGAKPDGK